MKEQILSNLNNPAQLEKLYRIDKIAFKRAFNSLYPELGETVLGSFWNERLNFAKDDIHWGTKNDLLFVISISVIAGLIAKLPAIFAISENFFYPRNIGFIIFPALTAYFAWKNSLSTGKIITIVVLMLLSLIYINSLPDDEKSDTLILSCIHLLLFLWSILGFSFVGDFKNNEKKRLGFLKYNGDLLVMSALILISGAIMTGITIGLFALIGLKIETFYFNYVVVFGLPAAPIIGTYLTQSNPQLVGKVSPVIAKIFSPLVLVMLIVYLIAIIYSGKDPYNDRKFLLIFNALLIGVMAIIFFSVAEASKTTKSMAEIWILLLLAAVTVLINAVALSAIIFRISTLGLTPNRTAVLGGNILILINLLLVTVQLYKVLSKKISISGVEKVIAFYLPVYILWIMIVTFLFPFIFGFK
ncbi:hypothetical protein [Rubrolithibacter danxiaensis]|uniref:hypothetical protein n=1 Tax=Rubrolithibacter danxiaensis TaxID=3390805 RepID=UPI003BF83F90